MEHRPFPKIPITLDDPGGSGSSWVATEKIPEFDDARFDDSRPFDADAHLRVDELLRLADAMMNPMRRASARSKVGEDEAAVVEEMVLDVWVDLEAMFGRRMGALTEDEAEAFRAGLWERAQGAGPGSA
jgi:hypothetical protein